MTFLQHATEVVERAAKTFVEAFLATYTLTPVSTGKTIAVSSLGAAISAIWTTAVKLEGSRSSLLSELEEDADHIFLDEDDDDDEDDDEPETPAAGTTVPPAAPQTTPPVPQQPPTPPVGSTV